MTTCVILLRGVNVGGKNPVSMGDLRGLLEDLGCTNVATYLASGNAIVDTSMPVSKLTTEIEKHLPTRFTLHDEAVKVLVLTAATFRAVIAKKPADFGDEPTKYHSDAIFLMPGLKLAEAMKVFDPRDGVDAIWPGTGVVYSRRLSAQRTKSRLSKIVATPAYKSMTIRSWQTATKLLGMLDAR